jgi:hypothetical protein
MKHMLISIYTGQNISLSVFTPDETHVIQYLTSMKHMLINIYP